MLTTIILTISIWWWYFGLFSEYNYFAAKRDIRNGNVRYISYGLPMPTSKDSEINIVMTKYGFEDYNIGCIVTEQEINAIGSYNKVVDQYLIKRNGKNWNYAYQKEVDALYKVAFNQIK